MGNTQSSPQKGAAAGDTPNGQDDRRAAKRRRLDVDPTPPHALDDQLFHAREVGDIQHNLCVQVHRIIHKDSKRVSSACCDDPVKLRARCKVLLWHVSKNGEVLLHCNSQLCDIKSFKDPGGPLRMARIYLQRPFYIPKDCMRVNRDEDNSFDLGDVYRLCVEIEAAGPTYWPPIILTPSTEPAGRAQKANSLHWVFQAATSDLFTRRSTVKPDLLNLKVKKSPTSLSPTDHLIEVDARWTTAFEASAFRPLEQGVQPSITCHGDGPPKDAHDDVPNPQSDSPPGTPQKAPRSNMGTPVKGLKNGLLNGNAHEDDEIEEETTPNRSLRVRGTQTYNLKVLSDKAQGREKKRRKRREATASEEGTITYYLPSEQVSLDSYRCISCGQPHNTLPQLQAHLISQHAEYVYRTQNSGRGVEFDVLHRYESYVFGAEPFSLRQPTKAFDLDQYADGNVSILTNRFGPEDKLSQTARPRGRSRPPVFRPPQNKTKLIIPEIKSTVYDPISRATLEPGTEYKKPEPNDQWLIQWHRDALADFSDVPIDEREYMQEWDQFMLTKRISSDIYFPRAWLDFVKLNVDWLLSSKSRMVEFGKHFTYLLARSSLDHDTVQEALEYIAACRTKLAIRNGNNSNPPPAMKESPRGPHVRKSASGCQVCGMTVLGPRLLLCANTKCTKRLYHADCASETAKMNVEDPDWKCNQCHEAHKTGHA
ncbi:hypothetical protein Cob_v001893 [Colletotrichum orbiculare MAFF 240422]|uniref:Zinc finger PHD-type domain-containing protein n=1 Tax=Colletotrichum orbiculare (strain 104-T / ATCC 96160 / CBS 514.97 / LARS 414 / MAFF 240422) TaxID=1213857 RepID=A0A484G5I3_COLOR|nr:hypothetical protein Cob_v001893 [Colletotrichum orbiculare MAFF 240422]